MLVDKIPGLEWQTETVVVDFEMAFLSACKAVLPNIQFVLCFFHLAQRIQRNCDRLGLRQALKQDLKLRTRMKMLKALAFVPVEDVAVCFDLMCAKFNWGKCQKWLTTLRQPTWGTSEEQELVYDGLLQTILQNFGTSLKEQSQDLLELTIRLKLGTKHSPLQ